MSGWNNLTPKPSIPAPGSGSNLNTNASAANTDSAPNTVHPQQTQQHQSSQSSSSINSNNNNNSINSFPNPSHPSDIRPDLGGGFPLVGRPGPFGAGGGGAATGGGGAFRPDGMMMGPSAFRGGFGRGGGGGGAGMFMPGGGGGGAGPRPLGIPRYDPIGPAINDPDIVRGGMSAGPQNSNNYNRGGGFPNSSAPLQPGEPDNDALQPVRFGETPQQQRTAVDPRAFQQQQPQQPQTQQNPGTDDDDVPASSQQHAKSHDVPEQDKSKRTDGCPTAFNYGFY